MLGAGLAAALLLLRRLKPRAVVGFGGYPTVPPLMAAWLLGVPSVLHEQNAVMGRANRFLAPRVTLIATGFPELKGVAAALGAKAHYTGNPVRPAVIAAAQTPYPDFDGARLNVLITGGSQGARVMADVAPAALALLDEARARAHPPDHAGARRGQSPRRGGVRARWIFPSSSPNSSPTFPRAWRARISSSAAPALRR